MSQYPNTEVPTASMQVPVCLTIYAENGRAGNLKNAMFHAAHQSHIIEPPLYSVNETVVTMRGSKIPRRPTSRFAMMKLWFLGIG